MNADREYGIKRERRGVISYFEVLLHFWDFFFVFYFCGCVVVENSH